MTCGTGTLTPAQDGAGAGLGQPRLRGVQGDALHTSQDWFELPGTLTSAWSSVIKAVVELLQELQEFGMSLSCYLP